MRALLRRDSEGPWDEVLYCDLGRECIPTGSLEGVNRVFHLAGVAQAQGIPDAVYTKVNLGGTRLLIEAAAVAGVEHFVYFSSVKAMPDPEDEECVDESRKDWPMGAYGRSKRQAEDVVIQRANRAKMDAVVLRPTLVYGPHVKGNLSKILRLIDSGFCPGLPDTGNRRSMVHVEDLCSLALRVPDIPEAYGKRFIVADNRPHSTRELYESACKALGRPVSHWTVPVPLLRFSGRVGDWLSALLDQAFPLSSGMISRLLDSACYDARYCQRELCWCPRHDLLSSMPEMVAAWRKDQNGE